MFTIALTLLFLWIVYYTLSKYSAIAHYLRIQSQLNKFPSPASHWLYGSMLELSSPHAMLTYLESLGKMFPSSSFTIRLGHARLLVCNTTSSVKAVITANSPKDRNHLYRIIMEFLGDGLLVANGGKWSRNRKLLTPAFHFDVLKNYVPLYNQCVDTLLEKWSSHARSGEFFEEYRDINLMNLDIILQCAFSVQTQCQTTGYNHPYVKAVRQIAWLLVNRFLKLTGLISSIYKWTSEGKQFYSSIRKSHEFTEAVVKQRQQEYKDKSIESIRDSKEYLDFLDILLTARDQDGNGMSMLDICNEVNTFMFEGHDTTSSALSFTIYLLGKYAEHQEKVCDEIDYVLQGRKEVTWNDLSALKYTTLCIKEALRLYPTVPVVGRTLNKSIEIDGIMVPEGTDVMLPIMLLHSKSNSWENEDHFDPLRFSQEQSKNRDPYNYIPFSVGSRNCIGQTFAMNVLKVAIAKIFQRYKVEIDTKKLITKSLLIVMKSKDGLWVKIKERQQFGNKEVS